MSFSSVVLIRCRLFSVFSLFYPLVCPFSPHCCILSHFLELFSTFSRVGDFVFCSSSFRFLCLFILSGLPFSVPSQYNFLADFCKYSTNLICSHLAVCSSALYRVIRSGVLGGGEGQNSCHYFEFIASLTSVFFLFFYYPRE